MAMIVVIRVLVPDFWWCKPHRFFVVRNDFECESNYEMLTLILQWRGCDIFDDIDLNVACFHRFFVWHVIASRMCIIAVSKRVFHFFLRFFTQADINFRLYRNPTEDQIFSYIDQLVDLNDVLYPNEPRRANAKKRNSAPFRISQIIESCHANESMFQVEKWERKTNVAPRHIILKFNRNFCTLCLGTEIGQLLGHKKHWKFVGRVWHRHKIERINGSNSNRRHPRHFPTRNKRRNTSAAKFRITVIWFAQIFR